MIVVSHVTSPTEYRKIEVETANGLGYSPDDVVALENFHSNSENLAPMKERTLLVLQKIVAVAQRNSRVNPPSPYVIIGRAALALDYFKICVVILVLVAIFKAYFI